MEVLTFGKVKASSQITNVAGVCVTSSEFKDRINDVCRRLMRRGDFPGTLLPIQVCIHDGCVTWPRYVETVRAINICNRPITVSNKWYGFLPGNQRSWWTNCLNSFGGASCHATQQYNTPVFSDIYGSGRYVRFFAEKRADFGKKITVYGIDDATGLPLLQKDADGIWIEGNTVTLQSPFGSTSTTIRRVDRILKEETQGMVFGYGYNAAENVMEPLATYEPTETSPAYVRYKLSLPRCTTGNGTANACDSLKSVMALIKLAFIPVKADTDVVLIQNIDALKMGIQSMRYEESGEIDKKRGMELDAIRELNLDLNNISPIEEIPVDVQSFGSALPSRAGIGRLL